MEAFLEWFAEFMGKMVGGVWQIIKNFGLGLYNIFNIPGYIDMLSGYRNRFGTLGWILAITSFILTYAIWAGAIFLIILLIRKYIRFRHTLMGNEDLLEEISDLHGDVMRLNIEKEKLLAMKVSEAGMSYSDVKDYIERSEKEAADEVSGENSLVGGSPAAAPYGMQPGVPGAPVVVQAMPAATSSNDHAPGAKRFYRLSAVDEKYEDYEPPVYDNSMNLAELCEDIRNFACYNSKLFYEPKVIRLMIAGLASTKLILLQGISGTGKTSLPYIMGKYFQNDTTIASVQPSWRDRSELFGYFNEFTKKFNETEVLRRIYESAYIEDINIIVLDEMNIARVEYYFAEMLSILEMPDPSEWKIELVPSTWDTDPKLLGDGKLQIPQNVWYIGTANNDDSTFAVSDKVYDRALVINLDTKGIPFEPVPTQAKKISYSHVEELYKKAFEDYPVSEEMLDNIGKLDLYVIEKFRVAFGNRIMKQLKLFVPVYVACGGTELEGIDYILATKVFRKFESLNLSLIRDEIKGLILFMDNIFGKGEMKESIAFLQRLQKMY